jgi:DNA-directed RNA polymerase specialized sigma24 family protein
VLEDAKRGDPSAFAKVVRHYDPGLRALAYRLLGDRDRMDEALQEAYLKAYRALPHFRGGSKLGTWLYRIAYNACLDELERSRRVIQGARRPRSRGPRHGPHGQRAHRFCTRFAKTGTETGTRFDRRCLRG